MSSKYTKPCQGYQEMKSTFWENDGEFISAFFLEFQTGKKGPSSSFLFLLQTLSPPEDPSIQKVFFQRVAFDIPKCWMMTKCSLLSSPPNS